MFRRFAGAPCELFKPDAETRSHNIDANVCLTIALERLDQFRYGLFTILHVCVITVGLIIFDVLKTKWIFRHFQYV